MSLIKEFNTKINKIYLDIINKYIKSLKNTDSSLTINKESIISSQNIINSNYISELVLFEKNLIDFKENQIKFYSKLLKFLKKYENEEISLQLNELYKLLLFNNINNNKENHLLVVKPLKLKKLLSYKYINSNSSTTLSLTSLNVINTKLPILKNKNNINSLFIDNNINNINSNIEMNSITENSSKQQIFVEDKQVIKNVSKNKINNNIYKNENIKNKFVYNENKKATDKIIEKNINTNNKNSNINLNNTQTLQIITKNKKLSQNSMDTNPKNDDLYKIIENKNAKYNLLNSSIEDIFTSAGNKPISIEEVNKNKNGIIIMKENNRVDLIKNDKKSTTKNILEIKDIINSSRKINNSNLIKNIFVTSKKKKKSFSRFDFLI